MSPPAAVAAAVLTAGPYGDPGEAFAGARLALSPGTARSPPSARDRSVSAFHSSIKQKERARRLPA